MSKLRSWSGKLRGNYILRVRGTTKPMPPGITIDEYKRVANGILRHEGVLQKRLVRALLGRDISIKEFDGLVLKLRKEGRLIGDIINLDARPITLRRMPTARGTARNPSG